MFWTASDNHNLLPRAVSRRADASIPLRADRSGQARHWTRERQTRNELPWWPPGPVWSPHGQSAQASGVGFCRDCVVSRAIDPAPVVALRIAHSQQPRSGAICCQLATQERPSPNPRQSPHAAMYTKERWCTKTSALLRFETARARRQPGRGCDAVELQVFRYPSAKGRVTNLRQCDHPGLSEACGIGSTKKHMYNTRPAGAFRNPRVGGRKQPGGQRASS
ncbi:hypothetical protein B0T18DRAFT_404498 [Schizothecium vesticola]|uniref:Uncharacterized protein n=1 Tax=Schizothecium vesticola TaxID=314040 RepID=A0AA40F6X3_9PEZI|nr:hypothetical protein B0T18DRAFT_404498 [Schizothecium vesticola]